MKEDKERYKRLAFIKANAPDKFYDALLSGKLVPTASEMNKLFGLKKSKRGQVTLFLTFMVLAIFIVVLGALFAPMGVLFNEKMYEAGEEIMLQANASAIKNINDATVRNSITNVISTGLEQTENNIDVNTTIFQYSWVILLLVTGLVVFLQSRRMVEYGAGGFI